MTIAPAVDGFLRAIEQPHWSARGACNGVDPDLFYPEHGTPPKQAKEVCSRCPVIFDCLDYALAHNEREGVWGGLSVRERRVIRRAQRQAVVPSERARACASEVPSAVVPPAALG